MEGEYKRLEDLSAYDTANKLSDYVWNITIKWNYFVRDTMGKQLVRAIDSIAANIAEGFGRYSFREKIQFFYYARGSVFESQFWCKKAFKRNLINSKQRELILNELRELPKEINILIKINRTSLSNY